MKHDSSTLPLYQFFTNLRTNGFELGIDDYTLLIKAMQGGFGMESKESLLWLCKTLWLKSHECEELFEVLFEDSFRKEQQRILWQAAQNSNDSIAPQQQEHNQSEMKENIPEPQPIDKDEAEKKEQALTVNIHEEFLTLSIEEVHAETGTLKSKYEGTNLYKFQLRGNYFPLTENELKVAWQFLRRSEQGVPGNILDIQSTIKKITLDGFLFEPVFFNSEKNVFELLMLIDHRGSMVAFHHFIKAIAQAAGKSSHVKTAIYYFFNVPGLYLYKDTAHTASDTLKSVILKLQNKNSALVIFSDGGAARGTYNPERIEATRSFINKILPLTHRIAWINPVPQYRWTNTSAQNISKFVPMFEATKIGIYRTVNFLRGKLKDRQAVHGNHTY